MKKTILLISILVFLLISFNISKASSCPFDTELYLGMENSKISELQKFLSNDKDIYSGPITGYFGKMTQAGVKRFQTTAGLLETGRVDIATATILCQLYLSFESSQPTTVPDAVCPLQTDDLGPGTYENTTLEVKFLQKLLNLTGYYPENIISGYYGKLTAKAVKSYQTSNNLNITGVVDNDTRNLLCNLDNDTTSKPLTSGAFSDLTITDLNVTPTEINVDTKINIVLQEQNIGEAIAKSHRVSLFINEKEEFSNTVSSLNVNAKTTALNVNWTCKQKGIYIFKFFLDSQSQLIENNKFNNVFVVPVNCGGVTQTDYKYSCNSTAKKCEISSSGSLTKEECEKQCLSSNSNLPDLLFTDLTPLKVKINEKNNLILTEKNQGKADASYHNVNILIELGNNSGTADQQLKPLSAGQTQTIGLEFTCQTAGVYTFTFKDDSKDDIKESNENNNTKSFKIECSDESGKVPPEIPKTDDPAKPTDPTTDRLPDLSVSFSPTSAKFGETVSTLTASLKNDSSVDAVGNIKIKLWQIDSTGKETIVPLGDNKQEYALIEKGVPSNWNYPWEFKDIKCEDNNPYKIKISIDTDSTIKESNENNNTAIFSCNSTGASETPPQTPPPSDKTSNCGSDPKYFKLDLTASVTASDTHNRTISYTLTNSNSAKAENIKVSISNDYKMISSILGCRVASGSINYTCVSSEQKATLSVSYYGGTSFTKKVDVLCPTNGSKPPATNYTCTIDQSINNGIVKLGLGGTIKYTINNATGANFSWSGVDRSVGNIGYKTFSGTTNGTYDSPNVSAVVSTTGGGIAGVSGNPTTVPCPTFKVQVSGSTGTGKTPNLSGYCSVNPGSLALKSTSSPNSDICFTPYVYDTNSICTSYDYTWNISIGSKVLKSETRSTSNKTICIKNSDLLAYKSNVSVVGSVEAVCTSNKDYSISKQCTLNATYTTTSSSSTSSTTSSTKASATPPSYTPGPVQPWLPPSYSY